MSKVYTTGDLYTGMKIGHHMSTDVWEIEEINYDYDDVKFVLVQSNHLRVGHHAHETYTHLIRSLNDGYYIEIPEETFEIET